MDTVADLARALLAVVFTVAAVAKLLDPGATTRTMVGFGVPVRFSRLPATGLPFAELAAAVALVIEPSARWGGVAALVLLLLFIGGVGYSLSQGRTPDCNCFGQVASEPISSRTIIRNVVLAGVAALVVANGAGSSLLAWTGSRAAAENIAILLALAVVGGVVAVLLMRRTYQSLEAGYQGLKQHMRTLPRDLPIGMRAPDFELPDVQGNPVALQALCARGRPVVLIFVGPNCGSCVKMFPDLARWDAALADDVTFAVISNGGLDHERIAEHLRPLGDVMALVQRGQEIANVYRVLATPTAIVIDPQGKIASPAAGGPNEIEALIRVTLQRPSEPDTPRGDLVGQAA
jgi:methylamine dehydrogenase accessory protein MauD